MKPRDGARSEPESSDVSAPVYRDRLDAAFGRIAMLEKEIEALREENHALVSKHAVPGDLARIDIETLPIDARRRVVQRRVRAVRRELRAAFGMRRYAVSAIVAVTAVAAFMVMAAQTVASWPLALAILGIGAVARGMLSHWPGFEELEDSRRKLAALKSQLDQIRADERMARTRALCAPIADAPDADANTARSAQHSSGASNPTRSDDASETDEPADDDPVIEPT